MPDLRTYISRIESCPGKQSHIKKGKSGNCGSSVSLNPVKEDHGKLPVKQISGKEKSPETEKSKTPVRGIYIKNSSERYIKNSSGSSEKSSEEIHSHQ